MIDRIRGRRPLLVMAVATLVAIAAAGCGGSSGGHDSNKTIRYQSFTGNLNVPELAAALGYLKGIDLKRIGTAQGGPQTLQALVSGQVDIGSAFNGAIAQLNSTGAPIISLVEWLGSSGAVSTAYYVKSNSGITSAKDLIGKKVALNAIGANAEAFLDTYLQRGGLTEAQISKVTLVPLPLVNEEAALQEGKVDAAWLPSGAAQVAAAQQGGLHPLIKDTTLVGPYNAASIAMRKSFVAQNPALTKEFIAGCARAVAYSQTHPIAQTRKLMQQWLIKHGRSDDAKALASWNGTGVATHGATIRPRDFSLWTNWLKSRGNTKVGSLKVTSLFTNKYNPYASAG